MGLTWTPSSPSPASRDPLTRVARARPAKAGRLTDAGFEQLAQRIRAEYLEMPGLNLTREQAQCLWGLDAALCTRLLTYLIETGFLTRTSHATYVRVQG